MDIPAPSSISPPAAENRNLLDDDFEASSNEEPGADFDLSLNFSSSNIEEHVKSLDLTLSSTDDDEESEISETSREKSLNQLYEEREKLLSMLRSQQSAKENKNGRTRKRKRPDSSVEVSPTNKVEEINLKCPKFVEEQRKVSGELPPNIQPSTSSKTLELQRAKVDEENQGKLTADENFEDDEDMDEELYKLLDEELENDFVVPSERKLSIGESTTENGVKISEPQLNDQFKDLGEAPNVKDKVVMKHRGTEYFEVLPDGWIEVTHSSGVPVFLHKTSRVCTLSRPYFLGPGSVRNHDVPLAAVPCFHQRKLRERNAAREQEQIIEHAANAETTGATNGSALDKLKMPQVKLQTAEDFKNRNLTADQLHDYCKSVFEFERIQVIRFKSWSDHRAFHRKNKREQQEQLHNSAAAAKKEGGLTATKERRGEQTSVGTGGCPATATASRPMLPSNVKLITVPDMERGSKPQQKQFFLNPQGKTSIAVLHEYVQKVLKGQVSYEFSETRNAANPYMATVKILSQDRQRNGAAALAKDEELWVPAGSGVGNSKKNAKLDAARDALRVLVPGIEFNDDGLAAIGQQDDITDLFDLIPMTDSRVYELSVKAGQPTPFVILQECLKRHSAFGNTSIEMNIERIKHQQHEFFMKVGKHEVKVTCTNKKEGKQKAAQYMLEKLQPQIKTWGSLIRLYGYGAQRKLQETRKEKDSIIKLQAQSKHMPNEPNTVILDKLRQEMKKLYDTPTPSSTKKAKSIDSHKSVKSIDI